MVILRCGFIIFCQHVGGGGVAPDQ